MIWVTDGAWHGCRPIRKTRIDRSPSRQASRTCQRSNRRLRQVHSHSLEEGFHRQQRGSLVSVQERLPLGDEIALGCRFLRDGLVQIFPERALLRLCQGGRELLLRTDATRPTPHGERNGMKLHHAVDGEINDIHCRAASLFCEAL